MGAVTIFNHTDSTWYVSSKHPHFVRPLHGKRRHPLRQSQVRQTWTQSPASAPPVASLRPEARVPQNWLQPQPEDPLDSSALTEDDARNGHCGSVVPGAGFGANASSHIQRIQ